MENPFRNHVKGCLLFAGSLTLIACSILISWSGEVLPIKPLNHIYAPTILFLMSAIFVYLLLKKIYHDSAFADHPDPSKQKNQSKIQYNRMISYLGISIILLSVVDAIILSGYLYTDKIAIPFSATHGDFERFSPSFGARILVLSMLLAILGSLFFTANKLNESRRKNTPLFNKYEFWSGLWFRMGESCLFVFVLFVVLCSDQTYYESYTHWLPALSLMMGMFVKSGERLVFGIAERLLEMARSLLPVVNREADKPGPKDPSDAQNDEEKEPDEIPEESAEVGSDAESKPETPSETDSNSAPNANPESEPDGEPDTETDTKTKDDSDPKL